MESGEGTESAGGARRVVREESDRKSKPQVGISGQYMRKMGGNRNRRSGSTGSTCGKWEETETAGSDQQVVRAKRGRKSKSHVGIDESYMRKTG